MGKASTRGLVWSGVFQRGIFETLNKAAERAGQGHRTVGLRIGVDPNRFAGGQETEDEVPTISPTVQEREFFQTADYDQNGWISFREAEQALLTTVRRRRFDIEEGRGK